MQERSDYQPPRIPWSGIVRDLLLPRSIYGHVHTRFNMDSEPGASLSEQALSDSVARYMGLFVNVKHDSIPPEFIRPLGEFTAAFPMQNWYHIMRGEIDNILYSPFEELYIDERPRIIPSDSSSKIVFQFLGYPDAETFVPAISSQILNLMTENGIPTQKYREAITLASQTLSGKSRRSGEPYICHIYRTIWYYLTAQESLGIFTQKDHNFVGVDVATITMHVMLEDGQDATLSETSSDSASNNYALVTPSGNLEISPAQYTTLRALQAWDNKRMISNVTNLDQSGKAAEIKLFDRMDNTLTSWYIRSWADLLKHLYKTYTTMGVLGWSARFSGNIIQNSRMLMHLMDGKHWEAILATNLISYGLYNAALEEIKTIFARRMNIYGMSFTHEALNIWMEDFLNKHGGIPCSDFPRLFSLKENVVDRYMEKYVSQSLFHSLSAENPHPRPFGFDDLIPYMQTVWDTCSLDPYTPYFPGKAYAVYTHLPPEYIVKYGVRLLFGKNSIPSKIKISSDDHELTSRPVQSL